MKVDFCQYIKEYDIHIIDYSGKINLADGIKRINQLVEYFEDHYNSEKPLKVLMDAENYIKDNPETHDSLAKISREKFGINSKYRNIYTAILNKDHSCSISEKEHWFIHKDQAINWLNSI